MVKKIIAILMTFFLVPVSAAFAAPVPDGGKVTLIIEVSGGSVLGAKAAAESGAKQFLQSGEAKELEKRIKSKQKSVMRALGKEVGGTAEKGYAYTCVFNGFSVEAYKSDIKKIKALPNVENVYISGKHEPYSGETREVSAGGCCEMMNTEYMHKNGYTGQGTVMAIVDWGFDAGHEIFKGTVQGARLSKNDIADIIQGQTLSVSTAGGVTADRVYRSEKIPYAYNYGNKTCDTFTADSSHGTHVAGIAGGNNGTDPNGDKFTGTAPDAQLILMACPNLYDADTIAAIDDAVKLGADVINASFGQIYNEENSPMEKAVNTAIKAGVIFSAAAGNSSRGYDGNPVKPENIDYGTSGTPDSFSASMSVASADNTARWEYFYTMSVGSDTVGFSDENKSASFVKKFSGNAVEYVYVGTGSADEFCGKDVNGKIALMERGYSKPFADRIKNAKNAGAVGAVFINREDAININIAQESLGDMPTAVIKMSDGDTLRNATDRKIKTDANIRAAEAHSNNTVISDFSTWGVNSTLELKPEITAPGGYIFSSVNNNQYGSKNGTSMAAPHITGAAALLKQYIGAHSETYGNPAGTELTELVENLMMSSADVLIQDTENKIPYSPRVQGAGMINLKKAVGTPVILIGGTYGYGEDVFEKSKISQGELDSNNFDLKFKAKNLTGAAVTYDKVSLTVVTDGVDGDGYVGNMRKMKFTATLPQSVTVPAKGETEITIPVTLDEGDIGSNISVFKNGFFVDGFVYLEKTDGSIPEISIPFTGFYGGWGKAPALDMPSLSGNAVIPDGTYLCSSSYRMPDGSCSEEETYYVMGTNIFVDSSDGAYGDFCSEEYAGISPDLNGEFDGIGAMITPLRQLGKTEFSIIDADGNEICNQTDTNPDTGEPYYAGKFGLSYLSPTYNTASLADGDYKFKVNSGFYGQKEYSANENLEMKFYVDREKPVIAKYEKRSEGEKTYLEICATDNRYLMGFVLSGTKNGESFCEVYPIKGSKSAGHIFDITGVDTDSLSAEAVDYAMNSTIRTEAGLDITLAGKNGNSFSFAMSNTSGGEISASVVVALFRNGELAGVKSKDMSIPDGKSTESFTVSNSGFDTVKVFVWDGFADIQPLYPVFEFDLNKQTS